MEARRGVSSALIVALVTVLVACAGARAQVDDSELWRCTGEAECAAAFDGVYGDKGGNGWYGYNGSIDARVAQGLARFGQDVYVDYTGSGVYTTSQLQAVFQDLQDHAYGNPHSANPSSSFATTAVESARMRVLDFFGVSTATHSVIFTSGATGALKLVGEDFPWSARSEFVYLQANHNSVLGIREQAMGLGASRFCAITADAVQDWLASTPTAPPPAPAADAAGHPAATNTTDASADTAYSLFAFPAEDNFAGVIYPASWVARAKAKSVASHKWLVLLDAAAFVPTQPLNLTQVPADFVTISFYKLFGYPTGLGALIVRNDAAHILQKRYFGGGTISLVTAQDRFQVLKPKPSDRNEDGTVAFLGIAALHHGLDALQAVGGVSAIQRHVHAVTRYMYSRLSGLRHANGAPMVHVFGRHAVRAADALPFRQGGILNINLLTAAGDTLGYHGVELAASQAGIHLRVGCECNPGACFGSLGVTPDEVEALASVSAKSCGDAVDFIDVCPLDEHLAPLPPCEDATPPGSASDSSPRTVCQAFGLPVRDPDAGHRPRPKVTPMRSDDVTPFAWHDPRVTRKPLGSVRISLGYLTTAHDVHRVVNFVQAYAEQHADTIM